MQVTYDDLIGRPFVDGGRGPENFDCWGLATDVFRRHGKILPDFLQFDSIKTVKQYLCENGKSVKEQRRFSKLTDEEKAKFYSSRPISILEVDNNDLNVYLSMPPNRGFGDRFGPDYFAMMLYGQYNYDYKMAENSGVD